MKKTILNFVIVAGITFSSVSCKNDKENKVEPEEAQEAAVSTGDAMSYEIDTTESTIEWRGTKPTGEHKGTIDIQEGTLMATTEEITSGRVVVDMNSITVTDEGMADKDKRSLENHLKGTVEGKETDFFNVRKYPNATFEITGVTEENGQKMLQGNLTLKEETKNIKFPVRTSLGNETVILTSEAFVIDRTDWGVNYGSKSVFDNLGDNFISDNMELKINVTARRAQ
ncbi:YceI family protein [Salinimicrobium sp. CAU 1759]